MQPKLYYRKLGLSDYLQSLVFRYSFFSLCFWTICCYFLQLISLRDIEFCGCYVCLSLFKYVCVCAMWCATVNFCVKYVSFLRLWFFFSKLHVQLKFFFRRCSNWKCAQNTLLSIHLHTYLNRMLYEMSLGFFLFFFYFCYFSCLLSFLLFLFSFSFFVWRFVMQIFVRKLAQHFFTRLVRIPD